MNVLMISGDKHMGPGHPRFDLQKSAVDTLVVLYWARGSLWPILPRGRFDVVTTQDPFWRGLVGWWAARRLQARLNVQVHADLGGQTLFKRLCAKIVLRRADSVRVVSENIKKQVEAIGAKAPIRVLPVFVDVDTFRNVVHRPHEQKTILWMGRFEPEKDPLQAVEVFQKVRESGVDAKLILLGKGSLEPQLRERAKDLSVEFPGWQDPLPYLAGADVVFSTSLYESWGASIVEALAAGVSVVAPDVGIAREAGAIVAERSQLAQKVIEVLHSEARGTLRIQLPSAHEWAQRWKDSLIH